MVDAIKHMRGAAYLGPLPICGVPSVFTADATVSDATGTQRFPLPTGQIMGQIMGMPKGCSSSPLSRFRQT